jgi:NAD(P)-dependent dehydrogenase (short-subunit alcohol dehydrogenase family)
LGTNANHFNKAVTHHTKNKRPRLGGQLIIKLKPRENYLALSALRASWAAFFSVQNAFRLMKAQSPQGGRIINNGSVSATSPRPNSTPYTATKHAITGLTKSASLDGRGFNIAVGQIDIGNAATDMTRKMETGMPQANGAVASEPVMDVNNVVQVVRQMAALPLEANIQFVTVMATEMPFIGRG